MQIGTEAAFERWQEAIKTLDWPQFLFALFYSVAALLAYACSRHSSDHRPLRRFWMASAILLLLIGMDTLLQASSFAVDWLRTIARTEGWYKTRRMYQYEVLLGMSLIFLILMGRLIGAIDTGKQLIQPAIAATALLACLFVLRTISFHDTDAILQARMAGISLQRVLELAGLGLSVGGSARFLQNY